MKKLFRSLMFCPLFLLLIYYSWQYAGASWGFNRFFPTLLIAQNCVYMLTAFSRNDDIVVQHSSTKPRLFIFLSLIYSMDYGVPLSTSNGTRSNNNQTYFLQLKIVLLYILVLDGTQSSCFALHYLHSDGKI